MRVRVLKFADRTAQGPYFHLTTVAWGRNRIPGLHAHDYPEIFWITAGCCEHRINGAKVCLEPGALVLMRPEDIHLLRPGRSGEGFEFANLAVAPLVFERLRRAYPEEYRSLYGGRAPLQVTLSAGMAGEAAGVMRRLASERQTLFGIEAAVLQLWKFCLSRAGGVLSEGAPAWLRDALIKLEEPEILARGAEGLAFVSGKSPAHLSRCCRRELGKTPCQLVNEARMRLAAHWLRTTSLSVLQVSLECGFQNPAQFHRVFKAAFGVSPKRFRSDLA